MIEDLNSVVDKSFFKEEEILRQRSKVISLTEAILEDPKNKYCQALLSITLRRLELLLIA
ncbi:MAG: hypothetical protein AB8B52_08130 [Winogradskyella sp.]|uniref:hypothetical protein n=1 Tax=Winogradskyella sp. TaxID=1883156 RepID=UPI00385F63F2